MFVHGFNLLSGLGVCLSKTTLVAAISSQAG